MQLFPEFRPWSPHSRLSIRLPLGVAFDTTASVVIELDDEVGGTVVVVSAVVAVSDVVAIVASVAVGVGVEVVIGLVESVTTSDLVVEAVVLVVNVVVPAMTV